MKSGGAILPTREGKGREGKERDGKRREGKGKEGNGREEEGRDGKGVTGKRMGGKGRDFATKGHMDMAIWSDNRFTPLNHTQVRKFNATPSTKDKTERIQ